MYGEHLCGQTKVFGSARGDGAMPAVKGWNIHGMLYSKNRNTHCLCIMVTKFSIHVHVRDNPLRGVRVSKNRDVPIRY